MLRILSSVKIIKHSALIKPLRCGIWDLLYKMWFALICISFHMRCGTIIEFVLVTWGNDHSLGNDYVFQQFVKLCKHNTVYSHMFVMTQM